MVLDEYKEIQTGAGQAPDTGATELPDISKEKLSEMPKEVVDLHTNAKAALAAATKRNQEAAEEKRQVAVEKEYLNRQREELQAEREKFYGQLQEQYSKPFQPTSQTSSTPKPDWTVDPIAAGLHLQERQEKMEREHREQMAVLEKKAKDSEDALKTTQSAVSYQRFFDREIAPKYKNVQESDLDTYLAAHPGMPSNPDTIRRAAEEIKTAKDAELEAKWQDYLKEKEAKAKEATIPGVGNVGAPQPVKGWNDMTEDEQVAIMIKQKQQFEALRGG